ncbi:hypothetical protein [Gulosibacter sediminis]|nr:hypothetical protein [Gulosibacter sediminis]
MSKNHPSDQPSNVMASRCCADGTLGGDIGDLDAKSTLLELEQTT